MIKAVRDNIFLPLVTRVGTMIGTTLLGVGAHAELVEQAILGVIAIGLIAFDLGMSYIGREKAKQEAATNGNV